MRTNHSPGSRAPARWGSRQLTALLTAAAVVLGAGATASASAAGAAPAAEQPPSAGATATGATATGATATGRTGARGVDIVPKSRRSELLAKDWKTSADLAWTSTGDATGFHVLVAEEDQGYAWRTAATLSEPGIDTDTWIGNACLTASGRRAMVVYAPRTFTNDPETAQRGGYTAVVDLVSGAVTKLPVRSSLSYSSPGCGDGESAVIVQERMDDPDAPMATRLLQVDAVSRKVSAPVEVAGQLTSAVPAGSALVAAAGNTVVRVRTDGTVKPLAKTSGVPGWLAPDGRGGLAFLDSARDRSRVRHLSRTDGPTTARELAQGGPGQLGLARGTGGRTFLLGTPTSTGTLPAGMRRLSAPVDAEVSTLGRLSIREPDGRVGGLADAVRPSEREVVRRVGTVTGTRKTIDFAVLPGARSTGRLTEGAGPHPLGPVRQARQAGTGTTRADSTRAGTGAGTSASGDTSAAGARDGRRASRAAFRLAPAAAAAAAPRAVAALSPGVRAATSTNPVDTAATCAVPRNDVRSQVYQPTLQQVEWAVDRAVAGELTVTRPANWKRSALPSYSPQTLFPPVKLSGGGNVPPALMLGILAQESNLWHATRHVFPGETGNPLIGNFYGNDVYDDDNNNDWDIDWEKTDCGYGLTQVTDGMRKAGFERGEADFEFTETQKRAAALDYAANIAAGLTILQQKWNQTYDAGIIHSDGDEKNLENWFFAVWAYNSGLNDERATGGPWGVGWFNNPANPRYPPDRHRFNINPKDAKTPQLWPYPEKVIGWAANSQERYAFDEDYFLYAYWLPTKAKGDTPAMTEDQNKENSKPGIFTFCDERNDCGIRPESQIEPGDHGLQTCFHRDATGKIDYKCWWHWQTEFNDCTYGHCGYSKPRYSTGVEPADGTRYPPNCSRDGLPAGSLVVDDVPDSVPVVAGGCPNKPATVGSFGLTFDNGSQDAADEFPSKIDFHQIGSGFGGHFWWGHTRAPDAHGSRMRVTGTWDLGRTLNSWARVLVHVPGQYTGTQQAKYRINHGDGTVTNRYAIQTSWKDRWINLGAMRFDGRPSVTLSSLAGNGTGADGIVWDAVAFQPLPGKPKNLVVSLGDSYSAGEGATDPASPDYYPETDYRFADDRANLCHRSPHAWSRQGVLADDPSRSIGERSDAFDPALDHQFVACSGASTSDVLPGGAEPGALDPSDGMFGVVKQLDAGYLDTDTTLVTLSIGGNDARFVSVLQACILNSSCQEEKLGKDTEPMSTAVPKQIDDKVVVRVEDVVREIARKAPNARIVLMGYPGLFPSRTPEQVAELQDGISPADHGVCSGAVLGDKDFAAGQDDNVDMAFGVDEGLFLNQLGAHINSRWAQAVSRLVADEKLKVTFSDPTDAFTGHDICAATPGIHGFVMTKTAAEAAFITFDGLRPTPTGFPISGQSFHPNRYGAGLYAQSFNDTLRSLGL